ncbi:MAG TPA: hypothetical protein VMJ75_08720 [Candidatus Acidoferrales bacterium]|nr:hypothetical protein [Candidatus Acidoferrales bacterium]
MTRPLGILLMATAAVCAQSLVEPGHMDEVRQAFDRAPAAQSLRCQISPIRPALTYGFRFQTGYSLALPLAQFAGPGHQLTTYVRVVPENHEPVYLTTNRLFPNLPASKVDAVADGMFAVGEGTYEVALLAVDDQHRACRSTWQIQARRTATERELAPVMPPGTVADQDSVAAPPAPPKPPDIGRITILLHAAPLVPNRPKMLPEDVARLTESVSSLMRQWPARSVRLIAFNLAQRSVLLRKDRFDLNQIDELTSRLEQLELGTVNYSVLKGHESPIALLNELLQQELQDPQPAGAILLLGPKAQSHNEDLSRFAEKGASELPIFYLQFLPRQALIPSTPGQPTADPARNPAIRGQYPDDSNILLWPAVTNASGPNVSMPDIIQRLVARFKGDTIPIRTPRDLADAIHRIDPRIVRSAPLAGSAAPVVAPSLPPAAEPSKPEPRLPEGADPIDVLGVLRDRVLEHGQRVPNHTCVETVERSRFNHTGQPLSSCDAILAGRRQMGASARQRLATTDRLRLDVALSTEREIYSWAGANKFEDGDIDELIPQGAMGTGPFASFLLSVFVGRPPRFVFEGETALDGRSLYEYSFVVPKEESRFRFKTRGQWIITGYSGSLLVDPKTSDLARLTVRTEELPPETETCEVDTTLDYSKVQLSTGMVFLPSSTKQHFIGRDGEESDNVYTFSACRDFQAESIIQFGDRSGENSAQRDRVVAAPHWLSGLPVVIEVTDAIDSATAAAGDRIHGIVAQPVRDPDGNTLVPQGTAVTGRLMRVEVRYPSPRVTVVLRWETLDLGGRAVPLQLAPNRDVKQKPGIQFGGIAAVANLRRRGVEFELPLPGEERYAVYHFPGTHYVVERGLRTEWVTVKP